MRPRVAVLWSKPRRARIERARERPGEQPDLSDGLLFLEGEGFEVVVEDPVAFPWNPLADSHEVFAGLDPLRTARLLMRARRYDAFVAAGSSSALLTTRILRAFGRRTPVFMLDPAMSYTWPLRRFIQARIIPHVDRVVVYGRVQLGYLEREFKGRARGVFIPHRADTAFYDPATPPVKPAPAEPYVLSIGDDVSRDFDTLIATIRGGRALPPNHRCVIHTKRPLPAIQSPIVHSDAFLSHQELRELYRHASAVVLPLTSSMHAGGINSLVEAMAMARPIIISRSVGIADYVKDGETALLVEPGDQDALAAAVRRILDDPGLAATLGSNARRFVVETCSNPVYAAHLGALLRQAIAEAGGSG